MRYFGLIAALVRPFGAHPSEDSGSSFPELANHRPARVGVPSSAPDVFASTIVFIRLRFSTASSVPPMDVRLACGTSYTALCAPCFAHASCFHTSTHGDNRLHPIRLFVLRLWFTLFLPLDTIATKRKGVGAGGPHPGKAMIDVHLQCMDGVREGVYCPLSFLP